MKLLVTGAAGFIGSRFCEVAIAAGHEVVGIDNLTYAGRLKNLTEHRIWPICYKADIADADQMRFIFRSHQPDAIVHLAAETHVTRSIDSREAFLRTNVIGTNVLLEVALEHWKKNETLPFRFLHVSTDEVYGSLAPNDAPWTEASPYAPKNPYSASKAASDHLVLAFHNTYGLPVIVTHSANNYGSHQHPEKMIPTLIRQCMNGEPMTLHGDGQQMRDWLHVDGHCRGLLAALERGKVGETYNFGGECERTNEHIMRLIIKEIGHSAFTLIADRPGNDRRYAMSIDKATRKLGWKPVHRIESSIGDVVRWYLTNPNYGDDYGR